MSLPVVSVIISLSSSSPKISAILSNLKPFVSGIHRANTIVAKNVSPPYKKYGPGGDLLKKYGAVNATIKFVVQLTHCCTAQARARYRFGIISAVYSFPTIAQVHANAATTTYIEVIAIYFGGPDAKPLAPFERGSAYAV